MEPYKNKCYKKYSPETDISWMNAKFNCNNERGQLASIPNEETNDFIKNHFGKESTYIGGFAATLSATSLDAAATASSSFFSASLTTFSASDFAVSTLAFISVSLLFSSASTWSSLTLASASASASASFLASWPLASIFALTAGVSPALALATSS